MERGLHFFGWVALDLSHEIYDGGVGVGGEVTSRGMQFVPATGKAYGQTPGLWREGK